jgi:hypothetical protein
MDFDHSFDIITPDVNGTITFAGTGSIDIPSGTTAQRPASPSVGMIRFNTTTGFEEYYNGTAWVSNTGSTGSTTDQYLRISATDTTSDFLVPKLLAGTGISLVKSAAGNETLTINSTSVTPGDQACIQVRRTTVFAVGTAFADVTFSQSDVLNNAAILNWTTGANITVGQAGPYLITYNVGIFGATSSTKTIRAQVRKNATTVIPGSLATMTSMTTTNYPDLSNSFVVVLAAADTLQLQLANSTAQNAGPDITMSVVRLSAAVGAQGAAGLQGPQGAAGSGSTLNVSDEGATLTGSPFSTLNFTGAGVVATAGAGGTVNISIPGGTAILKSYVYYPQSLDNPVNASWVINALSPMIADPAYGAFNVRQFSNTTEQGVGCYLTVPAGANNITVRFKGRAQTAPGTAAIVQPRMYIKSIGDNTTVGAWSAAIEMTNLAIPTDANFHYYSQTISLATLSMAANTLYQLEITRRVAGLTGGTNLAANWLMIEVSFEFT